MKTYEKITIVTIVLSIVVLVLAAFFGVYVLKTFKVSNIIPDYKFGMEFDEKRIAKYEVDNSIKESIIYDSEGNLVEQEEGIEYTEEDGYKTVDIMMNDESVLTIENYKKSKELFKTKLSSLGASQYSIKLNENNGEIRVEIPEDDNTDYILGNLGQTGDFSITDYQTGEVLLNNENLDFANVTYGAGEDLNSTVVYLYLQFDEEGTRRLKDITSTYVDSEDEENGKYVNVVINGQTYLEKNSFPEEYSDGKLYLTFGTSQDSDTIQEYIDSATAIANNLNAGVNPIVYNYISETKEATIDNDLLNITLYIFIALNVISFVYFIIKFKKEGFMAALLQLGYIAVLSLVLRVLGITLTIEGIIGIIVSIILNYMFICMAYNSERTTKKFIKEIFTTFALRTIPMYIIAIIFTFTGLLHTSSLGMTLVWGIITIYLYNIIFTNIVLKLVKKEA
ncbi:MAG: hypothetical protein E7310_03715 [Clostridiales bacterium]|nr:hypothetical protein [Clostridiales bacterium]